MTAARGPGGLRWWRGRRTSDEDAVEDVVDVIDLRRSALQEWERSADLVEYPPNLMDSCTDGGGEGRETRLAANKPQISVQPRGGDDQWAVQGIGDERAEKLYDLKGDAVAHALAEAKAAGADLVIEDDEGTIERWEGHDARPPG